MKYDLPIQSIEHAEWCKKEAARRYGGKVVKDEYAMFKVEDKSREFCHTDDVLRALSWFLFSPEERAAAEKVVAEMSPEQKLGLYLMREYGITRRSTEEEKARALADLKRRAANAENGDEL